MGLFDFFRRRTSSNPTVPVLSRGWSAEGVFVQFATLLPEPSLDAFLASTDATCAAELTSLPPRCASRRTA